MVQPNGYSGVGQVPIAGNGTVVNGTLSLSSSRPTITFSNSDIGPLNRTSTTILDLSGIGIVLIIRLLGPTFSARANLGPDYAQFYICRIYPGTKLWSLGVQRGIVDPNHFHKELQNQDKLRGIPIPLWEEKEIKLETLRKLRKLAYIRFYLRWRYFLKRLKKVKSLSDLRKVINEYKLRFLIILGM